uniref:Uncharacterized protein n=1 Tax=Rhizophora mucronata TaxID=61149 RepID=A0A2P2NQD2_RHIMU
MFHSCTLILVSPLFYGYLLIFPSHILTLDEDRTFGDIFIDF